VFILYNGLPTFMYLHKPKGQSVVRRPRRRWKDQLRSYSVYERVSV